MRLFLAYEAPPGLIQYLEKELARPELVELGQLTRKVQKQNWHTTILFCKDFPEDKISIFKELTERALQESSCEEDFVSWQQFEFWKSLICLIGREKQSRLVSWLTQHFPQELKEFTQFEHMQDWKPHITVLRGRAKNFSMLQEKANTLFPLLHSSGKMKTKWQKISLFKSPVEPISGIYERLWTVEF
ncbi:MAG: hypothetical protein SFU25_07405 [Candidatus Caenarcaniphilales bacterium]|nr:hypothetical protein [Candidatus Caenarcaniphilales bacterium]